MHINHSFRKVKGKQTKDIFRNWIQDSCSPKASAIKWYFTENHEFTVIIFLKACQSFSIVRQVSFYLELINDEHGENWQLNLKGCQTLRSQTSDAFCSIGTHQ